MINMPIKVKRLTDTAILPTYGSEHAAGLDLHADIELPRVVHPGDRATISTGIAMALQPGTALLVCPRSGLSSKKGVTVHNGPGIIDADYRGDIGVILHNTGDLAFTINPGDRIAQGVIVPVYTANLQEVDELPATARGAGGFGSTGS